MEGKPEFANTHKENLWLNLAELTQEKRRKEKGNGNTDAETRRGRTMLV